ncbi:MAG TPA: aminopeptidase N [Burkholderiales bacterium]|nr:aminopeptidase N [Burkholderiales bacterium]
MLNPAPATVYLKDYAPPAFLISTVDLDVDIQDELTRVTATLDIRRNPKSANSKGPLVLDADELELESVALDSVPLAESAYTADAKRLTIAAVPDRFTLRTVCRIHPERNTKLMGLYVSKDGCFTQCEAEGFRRITYFIDRPDVMARYTVTIHADKGYPVLLSNGNLVASGDEDPSPHAHPRITSGAGSTRSQAGRGTSLSVASPAGHTTPALRATPAEGGEHTTPALRATPPREGGEKAARHWARWVDPFPKPSYLFAMVAAKLDKLEDRFVTRSGREVSLQIYVEPGKLDQCGFAMQALKKAMKWDEQVFGLELDLDQYMVVAVGDFNMGAMENKGLNIFNTKYVLARPDIATDSDFMFIDRVVAHEYFHNWTGNRVTCRDWFQLSLKEGLTVFRDQEFGADMYSRAVVRIQEVRNLRAAQFPEDAGPMAHPVRPQSYMEISNFYTATVYEKGAEVVRMIHTLIGRENFRKGMDLYFQRFDGQAVTTDDFVQAMQDASGLDLGQFKRWYDQAGTPLIEVSSVYDENAKRCTLTVKQSCPPTPGQPEKAPLHIPFAVGLVGPGGEDIALQLEGEPQAGGSTRVLSLRSQEERFAFVNVALKPVPSLLRDFSAPTILKYAYTRDELTQLLAHDGDAVNRWEAGQRLALEILLAAISARRAGVESAFPDGFVAAFGRVLADGASDPAFAAEALSLPSESYIAEQMQVVDPDAVHAVRVELRRHLARSLGEELLAAYAALQTSGPYSPDAKAAARRGLRNLCLGYLMELDSPQMRSLALQQFDGANNMTDAMAALSALANYDCPERRDALDRFYARWKAEPLVVDKWLGVQATSRLPGTLGEVIRLMSHEAFNIKNPNKVYSLIGGFRSNQVRFHAADGAGYRFLAEQVIALDSLNPTVAARMARGFDRWRKFDAGRQAHAKAALELIRDAHELSTDTFEVVSRALA